MLPCSVPYTLTDTSKYEISQHNVNMYNIFRHTSSEPDNDVEGFVMHLSKHFSLIFCIRFGES